MTDQTSPQVSVVVDDPEDLFVARPADPLRGRFDNRSGVERLLDEIGPSREPLRIEITVVGGAEPRYRIEQVALALAGHIDAQIAETDREKLRIRRLGLQELVFGMSFLALCLLGGTVLAASQIGPDWLRSFVGEGLVIVGWIALWHPVDMLFFERLPLVKKQRKLFWIRDAHLTLRTTPADR